MTEAAAPSPSLPVPSPFDSSRLATYAKAREHFLPGKSFLIPEGFEAIRRKYHDLVPGGLQSIPPMNDIAEVVARDVMPLIARQHGEWTMVPYNDDWSDFEDKSHPEWVANIWQFFAEMRNARMLRPPAELGSPSTCAILCFATEPVGSWYYEHDEVSPLPPGEWDHTDRFWRATRLPVSVPTYSLPWRLAVLAPCRDLRPEWGGISEEAAIKMVAARQGRAKRLAKDAEQARNEVALARYLDLMVLHRASLGSRPRSKWTDAEIAREKYLFQKVAVHGCQIHEE